MIDLLPHIENKIKTKKINPPKLTEDTIIEDKYFREFIVKINLAFHYLRSFDSSVDEIKQLRQKLTKLTTNKEINSIKEEINIKIKTLTAQQTSIKDLIVENNSFVKKSKVDDEYFSRIVSNMYFAALKKFDSSSEAFSQEEVLLKTYLTNSIVREAEIATERKLSDREKEEVIANPNLIQEMIKKKLEGEAHIELVNKVNQLEMRHKDIVLLEKSICEMHKMFSDLEILVHAQGEIIENIEMNISSAKEYTFKAEVDINKADDYLKAARKKKMIILIIVCVVMLIVIGVLLKVFL